MDESPVKFAVGGPVQAKAGTYISRPADDELLAACQAGVFSYVLASRQIGKSSLMNETVSRLEQLGIKTARLDLNRIGGNVEDSETWYFSLIHILARNLGLELDVQAWWNSCSPLASLSQRFLLFFDEVVLPQISEQIIIFIDEIDMTLDFDFTDDFFGAIRVIHNERAQNPAYKRLTFVLLGVATPDELIKDHTRTPFNIGQAIILYDFTPEECAPFRQALEATYPGRGEIYFRQIYGWTSGHPYLTQKLCQAVVNASLEGSPKLVDNLVRQLFTAEEARGEDNIQFVQNRVLSDPYAQAMLKVYKHILQDPHGVPDDKQSPAINRLKLYGLILTENDRLQVRNKIYAEAFDLDWIDDHFVTNRFRNIAIGVIALLLVVSMGLFIRNQQIAQENRRITEEIQRLQNQIRNTADETMQTEFVSLIRLIEISEDYPDRLSDREIKVVFEDLSYAQKLYLFESATEFAQPDEYLKLVEKTYTWLDNSEDNNNLLDKMQLFLAAGYPWAGHTSELVTKINKLRIGRDHLANQRWSEAEAIYTTIIEQTDRVNPYTYLERGQMHLAQDDRIGALDDFEKFLSTNIPDTTYLREIFQDSNLRQAIRDNQERYQILYELLNSLNSEDVAQLPTATTTPTPTTIGLATPTGITPSSEHPISATPPVPEPTYVPPQLIKPINGVGRLAELPTLTWRLEGYTLKTDEYFSLRIWSNNPEATTVDTFLLNRNIFDSNLIYPENGKLNWTVTIVKAENVVCNEFCGGTVIGNRSPASEIGWFVYDNLGRFSEAVAQIPTGTSTQPEPTVSPTDIVLTPTEVPQTPSEIASLPSPEPLTPTPTPTFTPTPTPTPDYVTGVVSVGGETRLMLRLRPVKDLAIIERLENGTDVIVLGRTDDSEWFRMLVPSSGNQGWVDPNFIILADPSEFAEIPVLNTVLVRTPEEAAEVELLDLVSNQRGTLAPDGSRAYRFMAKDVETILILVFRPNINTANQQLEFVISQEGQPIGVGGSYDELLEDAGLGGLTWRGGTPGKSYFLDIFNHSSETVEFCLSPRQVFEWVCN